MTLDECRQRVAAALEEIWREQLDESIARMMDDDCSDEEIAVFERLSGERFSTARADALADLERVFRSMLQ
jgi:hypothetical protein